MAALRKQMTYSVAKVCSQTEGKLERGAGCPMWQDCFFESSWTSPVERMHRYPVSKV